MIKGVLVAASVSALATVDGMLKLTPASAAVPPTWYSCEDYKKSAGGWDNGLWNVCNPDAQDVDGNNVEIGSNFCQDGYHRNDDVFSAGHHTQFERRPYSCQNKNAWVWHQNDDGNPAGPENKRCSDGKYRVDGGGWHYSVCKKLLP